MEIRTVLGSEPPTPGVVVVTVGADGAFAPASAAQVAAFPHLDLAEVAGRASFVVEHTVARVPVRDGLDLVLTKVGGVGGDREAAMAAARLCHDDHEVVLLPMAPDAETIERTVEGWVLGGYAFPGLGALHAGDRVDAAEPGGVLTLPTGELDAVRRGATLATATNLARGLVDTPASHLDPGQLGAACVELGARYGFEVLLHDAAELEREGFGGLSGVGRGSPRPPVLVELRSGPADRPHVALVGKGITFDAGGLSLKPTRGMLTMKADMSGAAAVLGAVIVASQLAPELPVRGYLACAENLPGPHALRIGDVITHRGGTTSEITDADCEGRLVLADAMAYAVEAGPARLVDIGTLTSSSGLGPDLWAGFGTDDDVLAELLAAGAASGEQGWRMPLWEPYRKGLRSPVAELRNFDPDMVQPYGGILAALYLSRFAAGVPWGHIDLGLTVMRDRADDSWAAGANGRGVRTLARFLLAERSVS